MPRQTSSFRQVLCYSFVDQLKMSSPLSSVNAALKQPLLASRRTDDDATDDVMMTSDDNNVRSSSFFDRSSRPAAAKPSHTVHTATT